MLSVRRKGNQLVAIEALAEKFIVSGPSLRSVLTMQTANAKARTAEQWRQLIFEQMGGPAESVVRSTDGSAVSVLITWADLDALEEIIRLIATYGVVEDDGTDGSGGSGDGEDVAHHMPFHMRGVH